MIKKIMEIKYLKTMRDNPNLSKTKGEIWESRGLTLERIKELEQKLNNGREFPTAFKEYLFLGGDFNHLGFDDQDGTHSNGEDLIALKDYYKEKMHEYKVSLNRPYVILDSLYGECFTFIYLDEGDDPRPYIFGVNPKYRKDGEMIFPAPEKTFSELINRLVDYALRGLQPW